MYTVIVADDEEEIRRGIVRKVRWEELGFRVVGEAENGDVYKRQGEDVVIITPTRIPYDQLTPEQLPAISLYAELLDGEFKPSSEAPMHTAIYRARPNLNGIVHTHSMFATVFSILEKEIPPMMPPSTPYAPEMCIRDRD